MHTDSDTSMQTDSPLKSPKLSRLDSLTNQIVRDRVDSSASERGEFSTSSDDEFFECDDENADRKSSVGSLQKAKSRSTDSKTKSGETSTDSGAASEDCAMDTDQLDSNTSKTQQDSVRPSNSQSGFKVLESESEMSFTDSFTHQPDGRSRVLDELRLLNVDEALYIPLTQEPAPMTEDMLEEHAEVLAK